MDYNYTLGDLIDDLSSVSGMDCQYKIVDSGSYRGYYDHAYIELSEEVTPVEELVTHLSDFCDSLQQGYKGGLYLMDEDVAVFSASYSYCSGMQITGLVINNGKVSFKTTIDG